ncbi:hypothetical protein [Zobellella denitrificans]|uniref:hypothetical protein n=1 Tax=Zobellella denitrificans TaxID=347534 RepID=UPI0012FDA4C0|nr:hypothetical protein [Zobellella denitrificans]
MALNPSLDSIEALYRKLERESYRAYHAKSRTHKADHLYNFCITAHSLRDYFIERKNLKGEDKKKQIQSWNTNEALVAVAEIANTSKHFTLRDYKTKRPKTPGTKSFIQKKGKFIDVYANNAGEIETYLVEGQDCMITLASGKKYNLYLFTKEVLEYWRSFLKANDIRIVRQPLRRLIDGAT